MDVYTYVGHITIYLLYLWYFPNSSSLQSDDTWRWFWFLHQTDAQDMQDPLSATAFAADCSQAYVCRNKSFSYSIKRIISLALFFDR